MPPPPSDNQSRRPRPFPPDRPRPQSPRRPFSPRREQGKRGHAAGLGFEDLESGVGPLAHRHLGPFQRRGDVLGLHPIPDDLEIVCDSGHQFFEFANRFLGRPVTEAGLHEETRRVQCGMGRTRMVDAHQRSVVEPNDEIARGRDAAHAVEGKPAGQGDDDAKGAKELVANGHRNFPSRASNLLVRNLDRHLHPRVDCADDECIAGFLESHVRCRAGRL